MWCTWPQQEVRRQLYYTRCTLTVFTWIITPKYWEFQPLVTFRCNVGKTRWFLSPTPLLWSLIQAQLPPSKYLKAWRLVLLKEAIQPWDEHLWWCMAVVNAHLCKMFRMTAFFMPLQCMLLTCVLWSTMYVCIFVASVYVMCIGMFSYMHSR
jgi:hypothetical protein